MLDNQHTTLPASRCLNVVEWFPTHCRMKSRNGGTSYSEV